MTHAQTVVLSALVVALGVVLVVALVLDGLRSRRSVGAEAYDETKAPRTR